jgi:hypothetical protein
MQLKNLECQLATAQISRYLSGDSLCEEAVAQLEGHISRCEDCRQQLSDRRAELMAKLTSKPSEGPDEPERTLRTRFDLAEFIKSKVQTNRPVTAAIRTDSPKPPQFTKPALYSLALGAVLIGMSYASKNVGSVLGPKAAEKLAPITEQDNEPEAFNPAPIGVALANAVQDQAALPATTVTPATPIQVLKKPKQIQSEPKLIGTHRRKAPRPETNTIRVYAPEN